MSALDRFLTRRSPGRWLQVIGVAHVFVGVAIHREALADVVRSGVFDTIPDHGPRATAFWFLLVAPMTWAVGRLLRAAEHAGDGRAQRTVGAVVAAVGLLCAVANPVSPFWLVAATGAAALRRGALAVRDPERGAVRA